MKFTRREFLTLSGIAAMAALAGDSTPVRAQVSQARRVGAWLRMQPTTDIPTSEAAYTANAGLFDRIYPTHGGKLQADGTWYQEPWKFSAWAHTLPEQGKLYLPSVGNDRAGILAVMDNSAIQVQAADNLLTLASSRFDAPWPGVMLDFEGIPSTYRDRLSAFYRYLCGRLHDAGLYVAIWARGRTGDSGMDYDDAYTNDFAVIAECADQFSMGVYGYWKPLPRSMSPAWYQRECIEYALSKGATPDRLILGIGTYSKINNVAMTQDQAWAIAGTDVQWITSNDNGTICEWYAPAVNGWLHDGRTLVQSLALADEYGLGVELFTPEMAGADVWKVMEGWN